MARFHFRLRLLVLLASFVISALSIANSHDNSYISSDSLVVRARTWNEAPSGRMARSVYPVKMSVYGHSLRVVSKHEQILPIYTHTGTLYLAMQLTPGVNWLNGLPRGRYRINNHTINIR